ncbi:hypothetical protein BS17DRAFT_278968 [Gyrodon lividus]|nr:hypothetical protein BS17DRAFT_278968 [Gyrodon lividus]
MMIDMITIMIAITTTIAGKGNEKITANQNRRRGSRMVCKMPKGRNDPLRRRSPQTPFHCLRSLGMEVHSPKRSCEIETQLNLDVGMSRRSLDWGCILIVFVAKGDVCSDDRPTFDRCWRMRLADLISRHAFLGEPSPDELLHALLKLLVAGPEYEYAQLGEYLLVLSQLRSFMSVLPNVLNGR